jgi:hypothetical protein
MTLVRVAVADPSAPNGERAEVLWCDVGELSEGQREMLQARRYDGNVFQLRWSSLIDNERYESSVKQRSSKLLQLDEATTQALGRALERNEQELAAIPVRNAALAL